jgi:subtilisin family serine protease
VGGNKEYGIVNSLVRLGAGLAIAGLVFTGCGGGGGTPPTMSSPTPPPPPATQAELCPTSGASIQSFASSATAEATRRRPAHVAAQSTVPGLLAVTYSTGGGKTAQSISRRSATEPETAAGATLMRSISFDNEAVVTHVVHVDPANVQTAMTALRSQPGVKSVAVVHYRRALSTTEVPANDPYYDGFNGDKAPYFESQGSPGQWDMHVIQVGKAWGYSKTNTTGRVFPGAVQGAPIAVLDTGFDLAHPEFSGGKVKLAKCFVTFGGVASTSAFVTDNDGHGTDVAGYASGDTNNAVGFASVGFNTPLLLYRIFPTPPNDPKSGCDSNPIYKDDPRCSLTAADEAKAIEDAVANGAKVINLSIGAEGPNCTDQTEYAAIEDAINHNVVVVAAAGNGNQTTGVGNPQLACPAAYPGVIAAGASALDDTTSTIRERVAHYSDYDAAHPTTWGLVAPGGDPDSVQANCGTTCTIDYLQWVYGIYSSQAFQPGKCGGDYLNPTGPSDCRTLIAGTSMATPHVAGAAALLLGVNSALTPAQVAQILCSTADNINDPHQGCGRLNVYHALAKAAGDTSP